MFFFHVKYFAFLSTNCQDFLGIYPSPLSAGKQVMITRGKFIQNTKTLNDEYWNSTWLQLYDEKQWTLSKTLRNIFPNCITIVMGTQTVEKHQLFSELLVTWTDLHWEFVLMTIFLTMCLINLKVKHNTYCKQSLV